MTEIYLYIVARLPDAAGSSTKAGLCGKATITEGEQSAADQMVEPPTNAVGLKDNNNGGNVNSTVTAVGDCFEAAASELKISDPRWVPALSHE